MGPRMIRVLVVDDHPIVAEALRLLLEKNGMECVGPAPTGRQAIDMTQEFEPDVVLLDILMPGMDGLQALASIKSARPITSVIILTSFPYPEYFNRAIALGAAGFLDKQCQPGQILEAIRAVNAGEAMVDLELLQSAVREWGDTSRSAPKRSIIDVPSLTEQEVRVLILVVEGLNNAAIADVLSVSQNTIKSHLQNIFRKLGVSDRTQAAIWAMRQGLAT